MIIDTAMKRFLISGYDVVTVDELCDLTSSTKGSFYHFFENKESLAVDVVNHVWHQTQAEMQEIFTADQSAGAKLDLEVDRIASSYLRFDGKRFFIGCPIGTLALGLRGKSPRLSRRLSFALTHMHQYYLDAFSELEGSGTGESRARARADQFQVSLQGLSTLGKAARSSARIRELARQLQSSVR